MPLRPRQWEIAGVRFGAGTEIEATDFSLGAPERATGDVQLSRRDGTVFGRDYVAGRQMTWELDTSPNWTADAAMAAWSRLAAAWEARDLRRTPRAVMPLTMRLPESPARMVYGRPRDFDGDQLAYLADGQAGLIATFDTADKLFYSAEWRSIGLTMTTRGGGGVVIPTELPFTLALSGERQDAVVNDGTAASAPVITIHGPVASPAIEFVGTGLRVRLMRTLAFDESVTIDTRAWAGTARLQNGASVAGDLRGARLSDFALPPGQTVLHYSGTDLTGQSHATVEWQHAYLTP